jgi:hypothetical protein
MFLAEGVGSRRPARGRGVVAAAVIAAAVAVAWAPAPARADGARARAHFEKGKSYFQLSEYRKALEEFKAAHVEKPDAAYLYNIAECHRNLGEPREAAVFYQRFLKLAPPDSPMRSSAEKQLAELQAPPPAAAGAPAAGPAVAPPPAPTAPAPVAPPAPVPPVAPPPAPAASSGAPALLTASPAAPAPTPVYERPWFLTVVGAAVIGGALGVWALASRGGGAPQTTLGNQGIFDR